MATIYCDLIYGSDSNDGLTPSTPKLSLYDSSSLVTSQSDVIKLRGWDNYYTELTDATVEWTQNISSLTSTADLGLVVGDYIYKSTDIYPDIYKVSSVNWDGSTYTIGLSYTNGTYQGETETCYIKKLNLPPYISTQQSTSKDGFYIGTNDYTRTGTTISGGWNSDYTDNTGGYTVIYNNSGSGTCFNIGNKYWDFKNIIVVYFYTSFNFTNAYNACENLITTDCYKFYSYPYSRMKHARFNTSRMGTVEIGLQETEDMWCRGGNWSFTHKSASYAIHLINCHFSNANYYNRIGTGIVSGCTFNTEHTHAIVQDGDGMKCYYNKFNNYGKLLYDFNKKADFVNNEFKNYKSITGNIGLKINNGFNNIPYEVIPNNIGMNYTITEKDVDSFTIPTDPIFGNQNVYLDNNKFHNLVDPDIHIDIFLKDSINNMMVYNTATVKTETIDFYTGNTSLKIIQHNSNYVARAGTIEFFVETGVNYNISFYVKSIKSINIKYNFYQNGMFLLNNWLEEPIDEFWSNLTTTLNSSDLLSSGIVKLFVEFSSGWGDYILLDKIEIT